MKKIYQLSLAAALLLSPTFAATSFAQTLVGESWASGTSFEMPSGVDGASAYVSYKLKGSQAIVTGMNMSYTSVKIPATFTYAGTKYTVVGIADGAFNTTDGKKITSITLPSTITTIGNKAFYQSQLTSITLPSSLQVIGSYAFYDNDGLKSLTIPASVTTIFNNAFDRSDNVASLTFSGTSKCKTIGNNAFYLLGSAVTSDTPFTSISIPNSVTTLGTDVFYGVRVKNLTLGTGITTLPALATGSTNFSGYLESITMNGVKTIPANAFKGYKKLTSASFNAATTIGESAFEGSGLTAITIPSTVKTVNKRAFANCTSATSVLVKTSYASYYTEAFDGLPTTAKAMCDDGAYYITNYFSGGFKANPASVTGKLYNSSGYSVTTINASSYTITQVGWCALGNVTNVQKVYLPKTVTQIGGFAFHNCAGLNTLELAAGSAITAGRNSFASLPATLTSIKNSGCITKLDEESCSYSKITTFDFSGLKEVPVKAFIGCSELASITGTNGLTTIGNSAFENNAKLTSKIGFSANLTSIGDRAFAGCTSLTNLDFWGGLTTIGESAFSGCKGVTKVYMPASLKKIGKDAFDGCENLHKMVVGDIASYCKVEMGNSVSSPLYMYEGSLYSGSSTDSGSEVTKLVIPASVKDIYSFVFAGCKNVKELIVNEGVETIGSYSFAYMKGLTSITLPSTLKTLYAYTFSSAGINATDLTVTCNATTVPTAQTTSFNNITFSKATLNVPADTKSKYSVATGWKNFASKTIQTCAAPEISTLNGKVVFKTTTLGATVYYSVEYGGTSSSGVTTDSSTGIGTSNWITPSLKITAYTSKTDHANSPSVTKTITLNTPGLKGDVNLDGVVNIADVTAVVNAALGK